MKIVLFLSFHGFKKACLWLKSVENGYLHVSISILFFAIRVEMRNYETFRLLLKKDSQVNILKEVRLLKCSRYSIFSSFSCLTLGKFFALSEVVLRAQRNWIIVHWLNFFMRTYCKQRYEDIILCLWTLVLLLFSLLLFILITPIKL